MSSTLSLSWSIVGSGSRGSCVPLRSFISPWIEPVLTFEGSVCEVGCHGRPVKFLRGLPPWQSVVHLRAPLQTWRHASLSCGSARRFSAVHLVCFSPILTAIASAIEFQVPGLASIAVSSFPGSSEARIKEVTYFFPNPTDFPFLPRIAQVVTRQVRVALVVGVVVDIMTCRSSKLRSRFSLSPRDAAPLAKHLICTSS